MPVTRTIGGETFNLVDVPDSVAGDTAVEYANFPDGTFNYDTIEFAYNKRVGQKFFINTSVDYQWRSDFRSSLASNGYDISTSPLSADPIGINYYVEREPGGAAAPGHHGVPLPVPGALRVPGRDRVLGELPLPERVPVLPDRPGLRLSESLELRRRLLRRAAQQQPLRQRRAAQLPRSTRASRSAGPRSRRCWTSTTSSTRTR